jgi:ABC-2 type transport system permease protein
VKAIVPLAMKDLRLLLRDRGGLFVTFVFPLVYCIFFGLIFSGRGGVAQAMRIAVVDEDRSAQSQAFINKLKGGEELDVLEAGAEEAADLVRRGSLVGFIQIPAGFQQAFERLWGGDVPTVKIGIDPSREAEGAMIRGILSQYAFQCLVESFTDSQTMRRRIASVRAVLGADPNVDEPIRTRIEALLDEVDALTQAIDATSGAAENHLVDLRGDDATASGANASNTHLASWRPINFETHEMGLVRTGPRNSFEISFPQGTIWGVLGCAAAFAVSLVTERTLGTLARLRAAPIGIAEILAGKAAACFTATMAVGAIMFTLAVTGFGVEPDSVILLMISWTIVSLCFVGIMMLLSTLGRSERSVGGFTWAILLAMAMLGGGMLPLFFMPGWMRTLSHVSPVKWAILSVEGAIWRGFTLYDLLLPWTVLLLIGAFCFLAGLRTFRWLEQG